MGTHPSTECARVSSLHVDSTRASKLADQAFAAGDARDDTTRGDSLENIFAIPSYQVVVVDDISFAFHQLLELDENVSKRVVGGGRERRKKKGEWREMRMSHLHLS